MGGGAWPFGDSAEVLVNGSRLLRWVSGRWVYRVGHCVCPSVITVLRHGERIVEA